MITQNELSDALIRHRQRRGLSLAQVAEDLNVSSSTLSRLERGVGTLDMPTLSALYIYLDIPLDGYAVKVLPGNTLDAILQIIRADPNIEHPEGLCRLLTVAYKEMTALAKRRVNAS